MSRPLTPVSALEAPTNVAAPQLAAAPDVPAELAAVEAAATSDAPADAAAVDVAPTFDATASDVPADVNDDANSRHNSYSDGEPYHGDYHDQNGPFYAVYCGREVGVYTDFALATAQVSGFSHGFSKRFHTRDQAEHSLWLYKSLKVAADAEAAEAAAAAATANVNTTPSPAAGAAGVQTPLGALHGTPAVSLSLQPSSDPAGGPPYYRLDIFGGAGPVHLPVILTGPPVHTQLAPVQAGAAPHAEA